MRTRTLTEMTEEVRERTDTQNDPHVPDTEIWRFLNQSGSILYGRLVRKRGDQYFVTKVTFPVTAVEMTLPVDFLKLYGLRWDHGSGRFTKLRRVELQEYLQLNTNGARWTNGGLIHVAVMNANFLFWPTPPSGGATCELWYVPCWLDLDDDAVVNGNYDFDGVNGWEEWMVLDAAVKVQRKREKDTDDLERDRNVIWKMIDEISEDRDYGDPSYTVHKSGGYSPLFPEYWSLP